MKKIFTLTLVFLAMMFGVNAQYLLQEGFETGTLPTGWTTVDNDGDSYTWDASFLYQSAGAAHTGDGMIASASYINNLGPLTPDNWLISPAINLTAAANLTFWVKGQDASYASENYSIYVATSNTVAAFTATTAVLTGTTTGAWEQKTVNLSSFVGQTIYIAFRHHNTTDMYWLDLDDVEVFAQPTDPMISAYPSNVNFGTAMIGGNSNATVNVNGYNLTSAITATTTAPFTVSADGTTYGSTASLTSTGGTLYLRYTPTTAVTDNGTVTLSSTGATDVTVSLTGSGVDCSNTPIPYSYTFDDESLFNCWQVIDANNDGYTFTYSNGYIYYGYNSSDNTVGANDWLISPSFTLTGNQLASFDYSVAGSSYPEKFQVFAIGTDTVALTEVITASNTTDQTQYLSLSALNGVYSIAIHCISDPDEWQLFISNFNITNMTAPDVTISGPTSLQVGIAGTFTADAPLADTFAWMVDGVAAPSTTETLSYTFTTAGIHNVKVIASNAYGSNADSMDVDVFACDAITTFPFTETFDENSATRDCWAIVDANHDDYTIEYLPYDDENTGVAAYFYNSNNAANDWLISPELVLPTGGAIMLYDYAIASASYPEKYSVWVIPQNGTYENAINILPTQTITSSGLANNALDLSSYANQTIRIAFKVESDADMYYIYFDNVMVSAAGEASLTVDPTSMTFSGMANTPTGAQTANVVGLSLTNNITITATAPFEVSTNGTTFASTGTIAQATIVNTPFYVRMNATTAGSQSGTVTLTSGNASATINVSGYALDCSTPITLPYSEDFENESTLDCWIFVDADGDGYNWDPSYLRDLEDENTGLGYGHNGSYGMIASASWNSSAGALLPDNWLISPEITIPANYTTVGLSWYAKGQDASWAEEHYAVYVSTTGSNISNFTTTLYEGETTGEWEQYSADLAAYAGQNIRIAFRHYNITDKFWLDLDDISIWGSVGIENHDMNISVYPNPANNVLNINANCNINRVEVYNMMGQMVGMYEANDMNTQISTTALANGVYTVKIATENGTSTKKITVAR